MYEQIMEAKSRLSPVVLEVLDWVKTVLLAIVASLIITQFVKPTLVSGFSMYPTLNDRNFMVASKCAYWFDTPSRGQIIIFNTSLVDEKVLIKRVIGVPGDRISIDSGKVSLNGDVLSEPYINQDNTFTTGIVDVVVPERCVFVMGDNRNNSLDSRYSVVGFVSEKDIIGRVVLRIFPFSTVHSF